ncbi:MAG: hypothetical protein LQ346_007914 [Caloplaca aetnensis]|nr:MAG: hypothetical protein LQ346_007914 [Caloplaca aetnensis]
MADHFPSRRIPFILGLVLNLLSTIFFALATTVWTLLAARLIQGLSTAIVHTIGYTLLTETVGKQHLGKAMGYTSMALSAGLLAGPVLGGVLYEYCGYFQVYLPAFGLIAIEIILRCMVIENEKKVDSFPAPPPRSQKAIPQVSPTRAVAEHALPTESEPLLHPPASIRSQSAYKALLTSPRFLVALISTFVLNSIANGFDSTLVPFMQDAFDMRASRVAALFLALAIPMLFAPISGWLADRCGPRLPVLAGIAIAIPALSLLSLISRATTLPLLKMVILLIFVGVALALAMGPLGVEAISAVHEIQEQSLPGDFGPNGLLARSIGLQNTIVAGGGLLGPLYAGFVRVVAGWQGLELLNAALCVGILVLAFVSLGDGRINEAAVEGEAV